MERKSLKDLPEFLLFFVSQMGVGNRDKAGRDHTRRVGGLILGEFEDKGQVVVFVEGLILLFGKFFEAGNGLIAD
jgi:hypothetical protein